MKEKKKKKLFKAAQKIKRLCKKTTPCYGEETACPFCGPGGCVLQAKHSNYSPQEWMIDDGKG